MKYGKIENNIVTQIQPNQEDGYIEIPNNVVCGMVLNGEVFENPVIDKSAEELIEEIKTLVQAHLDTTAKEWGYDTIYTAVGYIGDPDPTFNSEGVMFRNWRSAVWVYVNAEQVKLENGQRTMPTDAELIAELPLLDTYK